MKFNLICDISLNDLLKVLGPEGCYISLILISLPYYLLTISLMVLILPRGAIYLYVCISIVDACSFLAACSRTHSHTGFCPRCPSICGRTDYQYHVAPADMLRLGLAVCLPLTVTFLVSFVKKQSARSRSHPGQAHTMVGPSSVSQVR